MIRSILLILALFTTNSDAFQSQLPRSLASHQIQSVTPSESDHRYGSPAAFLVPTSASLLESSSLTVSAVTLDPTAFFTNLLAAFLGSPLILAVPIVAALALVAVMAALIIGYASPAADDD